MKIYSSTGIGGLGARSFANPGTGREYIDVIVLRIANAYFVTSSCATDFFTIDDVKEGTAEQNFERSVVYDLDLEVDGDGTQLDWMVLDKS